MIRYDPAATLPELTPAARSRLTRRQAFLGSETIKDDDDDSKFYEYVLIKAILDPSQQVTTAGQAWDIMEERFSSPPRHKHKLAAAFALAQQLMTV